MLDPDAIERMEEASDGAPIIVALSGGGDSVALLRLLKERFGPTRLQAGIVDHALRRGSAEDAQHARTFASALGIAAEIITLQWSPQPRRGQQAARLARYRALCGLARTRGARVIALGHTADDQAETVLMRAASGSGWRGLSGMSPIAPAPVWPEGRGLLIARPLLGARRADVRNWLRALSAQWIEDPSNQNEIFERVRIRERLALLERAGFGPLSVCRLAVKLRGWCSAVDGAAAALIADAAELGVRIKIDIRRWRGPDAVRQRALQVLIEAASGWARRPKLAHIAEIEARAMTACQSGFTHSGVAFTTNSSVVSLARDPGAVLGRTGTEALAPLALGPGVEAVWDGRFALTAAVEGWAAIAADNAELLAFTDGVRRLRVDEASHFIRVRPLAAERVQHAFSANRK